MQKSASGKSSDLRTRIAQTLIKVTGMARGVMPIIKPGSGSQRRKACGLTGGQLARCIEPKLETLFDWKISVRPCFDGLAVTGWNQKEAEEQCEQPGRLVHWSGDYSASPPLPRTGEWPN